MLGLRNSLVIETTADPCFFSFFSPTLEGFSGVGSSVEDCLYKARTGIDEFVAFTHEQGLPVPPPDEHPTVLLCEAEPRSRVA